MKDKKSLSSKIIRASLPLTAKLVEEYYLNGAYMGFKKNSNKFSSGITLFDSGLSAINEFNENGLYHGYNIFFENRRLTSILYNRGNIQQIAYRIDGYLLYLSYGKNGKLDGQCWIVDYENEKIFKIAYENGLFKQKKIEQNKKVNGKVFSDNSLIDLIGEEHSSRINYDIVLKNNLKACKVGNKLQISFIKNTLPNGFGFIYMVRGTHGGFNPELQKNQDKFELKFIEKGNYKNNVLDGFGSRIFKNGNTYVGSFSNDNFNGDGILMNHKQKKWVYGTFKQGEMIDMIDFNNEGDMSKCSLYIQEMKKQMVYYVSKTLQEPNFNFLDEELQKLLSNQLFQENDFHQKKMNILKKIKNEFLKEPSGQEITKSVLINNLNSQKGKKQVSSYKTIHAFVSKGSQVSKYRANQPIPSPKKPTQQIPPKPKIEQEKSPKHIFTEKAHEYALQRQNLIKLHKINSLLSENKKKRKQNIFDLTYSPIKTQRDTSRSNNKSRSRKSPIFISTPSNKKYSEKKASPASSKKSPKASKRSITNLNESLVHWNSIRKEVIDKKSSIRKSPRKSKIFEDESKSKTKLKRFNYTFELRQ